jgi:hypothetical protein
MRQASAREAGRSEYFVSSAEMFVQCVSAEIADQIPAVTDRQLENDQQGATAARSLDYPNPWRIKNPVEQARRKASPPH